MAVGERKAQLGDGQAGQDWYRKVVRRIQFVLTRGYYINPILLHFVVV